MPNFKPVFEPIFTPWESKKELAFFRRGTSFMHAVDAQSTVDACRATRGAMPGTAVPAMQAGAARQVQQICCLLQLPCTGVAPCCTPLAAPAPLQRGAHLLLPFSQWHPAGDDAALKLLPLGGSAAVVVRRQLAKGGSARK